MFKEIIPVLPETLLFLFTLLSLLAGVYAPCAKARQIADRLIYAGLFSSLAVLLLPPENFQKMFLNKSFFVVDGFALWLKKILMLSAIGALAFGADWLKYKKYRRFEYASLLGFCVTGMMVTISAETFLLQFLGLEMMHFPLLFLTAYKRRGERSTEAGTKYVVMVFLSSGLYLFGVSVLYACVGTLDFVKIAQAEKNEIMPALLWGLSFVVSGLLLKIGVVPFHSWLADVYEGAPSPVTALFAMLVRLTLLAAFGRIVTEPFAELGFYWRPVLATLSVLSIIIGGFGAIVQTNVKRLTAYTVIILNGFALSALIVRNLESLILFLTTDLILLSGLSAVLLSLRVGDELSEEIRVLSGQGQAKPIRGALFSLIFLGLSGLPPFGGFWARLGVFRTMILNDMMPFCILLMLGGLLIMYVYLKLIRQMYTLTPKEELSFAPVSSKILIVFSAAFSGLSYFIINPLLSLML